MSYNYTKIIKPGFNDFDKVTSIGGMSRNKKINKLSSKKGLKK